MKRKFLKTILCLLVAVFIFSLMNGCYKNSVKDNENDNYDFNNGNYNSTSEVVKEN